MYWMEIQFMCTGFKTLSIASYFRVVCNSVRLLCIMMIQATSSWKAELVNLETEWSKHELSRQTDRRTERQLKEDEQINKGNEACTNTALVVATAI